MALSLQILQNLLLRSIKNCFLMHFINIVKMLVN